MNKWIKEEWSFRVEVTDGYAKDCRLGLEKGDVFSFEYETPHGFCPRAISEIYTYCEIVRCGGNFTYRGSKEKYSIDVSCPCNCIRFGCLQFRKNNCAISPRGHKALRTKVLGAYLLPITSSLLLRKPVTGFF